MRLSHTLTAVFAILANAQRYRPYGYQYQQRDATQVVGSDTGSASGSDSDSGSGSTGNDASYAAASSAPQLSASGTSATDSGPSSNSAAASTASFTQYSPCDDPSKTSCAWYSSSGYNAAISQAVYGGYPGSGPSGACGVCWILTPEYAGANEIVVKVNNLCPDDGNALCAQAESEFCYFFRILSRKWGIGVADCGFLSDVDVNFDLCRDSGAAAALFGSSGTEQVNGTAVVVDCSEWSGGADVCLPGVSSC